MIRTIALKATLAVCLALAVLAKLKFDDTRLATARDRAAASALALTNAAAQRDSSRDVAAANHRVATLLGDSLQLVERQAIQVTQRADALDRALNDERIEHATIHATVDSLRRVAFAVSTPDAGPQSTNAIADSAHALRRAHFELRQTPYTIVADAEVPPPPDSATIAMHVALDAIPLDVRLECSAPNAQGIRVGSIVASAPRWAHVRLDHVEQSPELCLSPALTQSAQRRGRFIPLVLGVGATVATHGASGWGLFLGAGIAL